MKNQSVLKMSNHRYNFIGYSALGLSGLLLPSLLSGSSKNNNRSKSMRPDIVVILADDLGWNDVCMYDIQGYPDSIRLSIH